MSQISAIQGTPGNVYPAGHVNHLTTEQAAALDEFKSLCKDAGCYTPPSDTSRASVDDESLLAFLRARRFVPKDALQQFEKTQEWREEQGIDSWYDAIDVEEFEATRILYTHWTGRRDKRGVPLYVFKIGGIDIDKLLKDDASDKARQEAGKPPPKQRRLFATCEHMCKFVMPLCSSVPGRPFPEVPISQTCCIVDIAGVGFRQFYTLKNHLEAASALATAHYPETLARTFVVGAPGFFSTVWSWIKNWFDPVTVSKIFIVSASEVGATLQEFIELKDIPKAYGGELEWDFGQLPDVDPAIMQGLKMQNGATDIPKGPIRWLKGNDETVMEAHALGTIAGNKRDDAFATVPAERFPI